MGGLPAFVYFGLSKKSMGQPMEYSEFYNKVKLQVKNCNKYMHVENTGPFQFRFTNKSDIGHRHYGFIEFWTASVYIIIRNTIFTCARSWCYLPSHVFKTYKQRRINKNKKIKNLTSQKKSSKKSLTAIFYQSYLNHCNTFRHQS